MRIMDLSGQKFGSWTVVNIAENGKRKTYWNCTCDCGNKRVVVSDALTSGRSKSCGCRRTENTTTHSMSDTKEYRAWKNIKDRCRNKNSKSYKDYGGKGIDVSNEWFDSFETFFADMGYAPSKKHEIDRIDNTSGYERGNCRWVTREENATNRSNSKIWIVSDKRFQSLSIAARYHGVSEATIRNWCTGAGKRTKKRHDCGFEWRYPR